MLHGKLPDGNSIRAAECITGNEIKKIANNSNPNCPGHIPWTGSDSIAGTVVERENGRRKGGREKKGGTKRERAKPLYNF